MGISDSIKKIFSKKKKKSKEKEESVVEND